MLKKIICLSTFVILMTSCADTWGNVKRGLTGQKTKSTDEFLVKKKDPLILPPDFESLPTPAEEQEAMEEMSSFEKTLKQASETEITSSSSSSTENSILKKIKNK